MSSRFSLIISGADETASSSGHFVVDARLGPSIVILSMPADKFEERPIDGKAQG
jgi:hypothetical protein